MGAHGVRSTALAAWLGLVVLGCRASPEEAARASVQRFFSALPAGDCAVLEPLLVGGPGTCTATVEELRSHGLELVEVLGVQVDGRNPEAVMVRARVRWQGRVSEQPYLLRVERHEGQWKLRF